MDGRTFVVELVTAVAWPLVVIASIILLRTELKALVEATRSLSYRGLELTFGQQVERLESEVRNALPDLGSKQGDWFAQQLELVTLSPKAAVLRAWNELEEAAVLAARRHQVSLSPEQANQPLVVAKELLGKGILDQRSYEILHELRLLRNQVKHYRSKKISREEALGYSDLALRLAIFLGGSSGDAGD